MIIVSFQNILELKPVKENEAFRMIPMLLFWRLYCFWVTFIA